MPDQNTGTNVVQESSFHVPSPLTPPEGSPAAVNNRKKNIIVALIIVGVFVVMLTIAVLSSASNPSQQSNTTSSTTRFTSSTESSSTSVSSSSQAATDTYTYKKFSIKYPSDWTVFDEEENPAYFKDNDLDGSENAVILEKDGYFIYIAMDPFSSSQAGGIFTSEEDSQKYFASNVLTDITGGAYYLSNTHASLEEYNDPRRESGILGIASLSEFIEDKVTNAQGTVYDGYNTLIENKNKYSYIVVKFSKTGTSGVTPSAIQDEIMQVLGTITW